MKRILPFVLITAFSVSSIVKADLHHAGHIPADSPASKGTVVKNTSNLKAEYISIDTPTSEGTVLVTEAVLKKEHVSEGPKAKVYKIDFENGRGTLFEFQKGAYVPPHNHDSDQITYMVKGKVRIIQGSDQKEYIIKKGDWFVLPAYIYHSLTALEKTTMVAVNPATTEGKNAQYKH